MMGTTVVLAQPFRRGVEGLLDAVGHRSEARADLVGDVLENGDVQPFLAVEVVADERLPDLGGLCDGAGARGVKAVAPEDLDRRNEQSFARRVPTRT